MKRFTGSIIAMTSASVVEGATSSFQYDYCSTGHSLEVYEDTANYFNEVFGGYDVPMDASVCPFHADNLTYIRDS